MNQPAPSRPWYSLIGPGLITTCVVIGPGSIVVSSKVGAANNFSMLWVVAFSVSFMMVYMVMGAKLGVVATDGPCELIRQKAGKWLSVFVGISVFFIASAFQSGNNIGVTAAFEAFVDSPKAVVGLVIGFNAIAISFLFAFKNLYKVLERVMILFVGVMLVSFAVNLLTLKPDPIEMAKGFIPSSGNIDLAVLGLIATTFSIVGAFYQAYLVRQKGWTVKEMRNGIIDARVGCIIMALLTVMLMSTAAAGFHGKPEAASLENPVAIAEALKGTFGSSAKIIFCLGLFSAAYSSFLINSIIGGFMAADGLGLGSQPNDLWPRILSTAVLLIGMLIALAAMMLKVDPTPTLIAAQAVTVLGAPLIAAVLLWLTSRKDIMGEHVNGAATNVYAGIGLIILLAIAANTAFKKIPAKYNEYRNPPAKTMPAESPV